MKTDRTIIRRFDETDFNELKLMLTDIKVVKTTEIRTIQSDSNIQAKLCSWILDDQVWCVECADSKLCIGWIMLKIKNHNDPELGYMFNRSIWGRGYATELSSYMIEYGFNNMNYDRIIACCDQDNYASIKVLKKMGMSQYHDSGKDNDSKLIYFEKIRL
jgi:RimJ/RimL family protein N-acetyltransferase